MKDFHVLEVNSLGYYCNTLSESLIKSEKLLEIKGWINHLYFELKDNIVSIFLRGSTATGNDFIESDIDVIIVLNIINIEIKSKINEISIARNHKYDLCIILMSEFMNIKINRSLQFITKTQSVCVFGKDLRKDIIEFNVSFHNTVHLLHLREYLNVYLKSQNFSIDNEKCLKLCSWLMRAIVRAGLELVVERENMYTRDLEKCYEIFAKYYPVKKESMYNALQLAIFPVANFDENFRLAAKIIEFIDNEIKKMYPTIT